MVYQIIKKLGSGSFGEVYEGKNLDTNQKVAIKKMKKMSNSVKNEVAYLRYLKKYCEKYILCYEDFVTIDKDGYEEFWIVTELVRWPTLAQLLNRRVDPGYFDKLQIMLSIAKAVRYLHKRADIIHRDLKPENIMINPYTFDVKLIDFGMCCKIGKKRCNTVGGTPMYMDPYLIENNHSEDREDIGFAIDIFSLGRIFLNILFWNDRYLRNVRMVGSPAEKLVKIHDIIIPMIDDFLDDNPESYSIISLINSMTDAYNGSVVSREKHHSRINMNSVVENLENIIAEKGGELFDGDETVELEYFDEEE